MLNVIRKSGFTIESRSTREYICLWKDEKLRRGMTRKDAIYLKKNAKKSTLSGVHLWSSHDSYRGKTF